MARDVPRDWMWSEACEMLARAERMHRELFRPSAPQARLPAWEPPVDILETEFEVARGAEGEHLGVDPVVIGCGVAFEAAVEEVVANRAEEAREVLEGL